MSNFGERAQIVENWVKSSKSAMILLTMDDRI